MTWRRTRGWRASRIGLRLLAFNLLVMFVPVVGVLYLDVYEDRLLASQERAMVQQGRVLAAALGGTPDIDPAQAQDVLSRLIRRNEARLRVFDGQGGLIADSADSGESSSEDGARSAEEPTFRSARERMLYRVGAAMARLRQVVASLGLDRFRARETLDGHDSNDRHAPEVAAALAGRYGAATRPTPGQRSLTLYSAVPVRHGDAVVGAVVVSQSTFRILHALYDVRLRIFRVVVASLVVAAVLTTIVATTIVKPLVRLRGAAATMAERRRPPAGGFPGAERRDEIGDLARALDDVTERLSGHIALLEAFAADVSHEFKNPLAAIRSAAETIEQCDDPAERSRFVSLMIRDVGRLERLVSGLRELARIDRQLEQSEVQRLDVSALLRTVVDGMALGTSIPIRLHLPEGHACSVAGDQQSLMQVFDNVLANAVSFSPADGAVDVSVVAEGETCLVAIDDCGPGIPEAHRERIFERFFTYRPDEERREHLGLGLAIARRMVEGHGGTILARNRAEGGARFEVRLPMAT
jgi:two-component system, OmpR family, sensor histidine kinase ChvG